MGLFIANFIILVLANKKERHQAYKLALETYKEKEVDANINVTGMCHHIDKAMINLHRLNEDLLDESCYNINNEYYPEFYSIKPNTNNAFWWKLSDTQSRIDAFNKIILMSK